MNDDQGIRLREDTEVRLKPDTTEVRLKPDTTTDATGAGVTIATDAIEAIRRHGAATFPHECCGALIGRGGVILEAFAMENTTASGAARRFRIGPDGYRSAEARARALGAG